jgi:signal transduction histidine kinase
MQRTIDQLLALARLNGEADASSAERCDAVQAAMQAVQESEHAHPEATRVRVQSASVGATVAMPEPLLVSALRNLLDNAMRAAPAASTVLLEIAANPSQVRFTVLDAGPGMSESECAMATQRFWRAAKTGPGSGLGLSITSSIAERYGGALRLSPRVPRGLCAEMVLPAERKEGCGQTSSAPGG